MRRRAAVLGSPVAHSLSPALHRAAYDALGLDWEYTAVECDEAGLTEAFERVHAEPGWVGLSLTMPLKRAALDFLDHVDPLANTLGAVNTVVVGAHTDTDTEAGADTEADTEAGAGAEAGADTGDRYAGGDRGSGGDRSTGAGSGVGTSRVRLAGYETGVGGVRLTGYNTDVAGVGYAIRRVLPAGGRPRCPLVVGAGGTARAALAALAAAGAGKLGVVARRPAAAEPLVEIGTVLGVDVSVLPWDTLDAGVPPEVDLVVATTPAGATDALAARPWPADTGLVELLYHPWPTLLAARAHTCGARVAGGLVVLAAQAVGQVKLFTAGLADVRVDAQVDVGLLLAAGQAQRSTWSTPSTQSTPATPSTPATRPAWQATGPAAAAPYPPSPPAWSGGGDRNRNADHGRQVR